MVDGGSLWFLMALGAWSLLPDLAAGLELGRVVSCWVRRWRVRAVAGGGAPPGVDRWLVAGLGGGGSELTGFGWCRRRLSGQLLVLVAVGLGRDGQRCLPGVDPGSVVGFEGSVRRCVCGSTVLGMGWGVGSGVGCGRWARRGWQCRAWPRVADGWRRVGAGVWAMGLSATNGSDAGCRAAV